MNNFKKVCQDCFPLKKRPLVHCLTNEVTAELLANALLSVHASPIMADSVEEMTDLFPQTKSVLINLGHLSAEKKQAMLLVTKACAQKQKPFVLDLVGIGAIADRKAFAQELMAYHPTVVKGNYSELRSFCDLPNHACGVDSHQKDATLAQQQVLAQALQGLHKKYPKTVFLATGSTDFVRTKNDDWQFYNGVPQLNAFTGTGDIVGALIAALLGEGYAPIVATVAGLAYFNCCGEKAQQLLKPESGMAWFRMAVMDQLSLLWQQENWAKTIKGERK